MNPEPNVYVSATLFCGFLFFLLVAGIIYWRLTGKLRIVSLCLFLVANVLGDRYQYTHQRDRQQKEVWERLSATAEIPSSGEILDTTFTLLNGSNSTLTKHDLSCYAQEIRYLRANEYRGGLSADLNDSTIPLKPGSPQSDNCLANLLNVNPNVVVCADVFFEVRYEIEDQPGVPQLKNFRFSTNKRMSGAWHPEQADAKRTFCPPGRDE